MMLKIEMVDINGIISYANNAKRHTEKQIEHIKNSIKQFGMNDPIAVWKNNEIIEGHGRLIACKELGIKTVPIIRLDGLTDEQRRKYALVHNQLTLNSGFDWDLLVQELEEIYGIDMAQFGFDYDEDQSIQIENKEYTLDSFGDEKFEYECPACGFKFNA